MAKTQMQLANRAWRTETKALGWHQGQSWKGGRKGVGSAQALNEMHVQFFTAGMNEKLPFNTSVTDFDAESADGKCHLNTARRKWVFRRIIDGVKPAPVVPLSITLPDTSSKAFWSGTGKKEVFHPETYKRWVKEAIERFCMIAGIAVEVKS